MAETKHFLGVDLGTSSVKVILITTSGKVLATATRGYELKADNLKVTQRCEDWFDAFVKCIRELMEKHPCYVEAVSFSGQMHGLVMMGADGDVLHDAILWNDQRAFAEVKAIKAALRTEQLLQSTGNMPIEAFILPKLMWLRKHKHHLYKQIAMVLFPKDYLIYKLCGRYVTDITDASGSGMFDIKNKKWSQAVLDRFNISKAFLPPAHDSHTEVGRISEEMRLLLKLQNAPRIIVGAGDQAANAIGLGVVNENQLALSLGTSACVFAPSNEFVASRHLHAFNHCNGEYHLMGVSQSGGGSIKWFFEEILATNEYSQLENIDFTKPSHYFFLPYLTGERHPIHDPLAKALFFGMDRSTTRNDMIRAVLEGVVFSINHIVSVIKKTRAQNYIEMIVGGGGGNNSHWMQALASMLNMKVKTIASNRCGGAMGAAIIAMVGVKAYPSYSDAIRSIVTLKKTFYPNKKLNPLLRKKYAFWIKIYPQVKGLYKLLQHDFH